jgi:hypothetical protein
MRSWIQGSLGLVASLVATQAMAAAPATAGDALVQAFVRTHAMSASCQKALPGLTQQLLDARSSWVSSLGAAQQAAAEAYAAGKDGKQLEKETRRNTARALGSNALSAAATCIGLLTDLGVTYPAPLGTAMPADRVQHYMDNFAPMALAALQCVRLEGIDVVDAPDGSETWTYRACGRVERVRMAPAGRTWSMDDASRNRLFDALGG